MTNGTRAAAISTANPHAIKEETFAETTARLELLPPFTASNGGSSTVYIRTIRWMHDMNFNYADRLIATLGGAHAFSTDYSKGAMVRLEHAFERSEGDPVSIAEYHLIDVTLNRVEVGDTYFTGTLIKVLTSQASATLPLNGGTAVMESRAESILPLLVEVVHCVPVERSGPDRVGGPDL